MSQDPAELQAMAAKHLELAKAVSDPKDRDAGTRLAVECHKAATRLALKPESKNPEPFVDPPLDH